MDKKQWSIAHDIAFDLVDWGTDPNELGKVVAFMRRYKGESDAKNRLMSLIQRLANTRNALIRSRQTQRFYRNIQEACETHLYDVSDTGEILTILGWSLRLMRYYRVEPERAVEEQRRPQAPQQIPEPPSTQTPQPPKEPEKPKIKVGDRVNATILKKDGFKVTVQLQTNNNEQLVFEHPYYPGLVGAKIKLRVQGVSENGAVTKVIP
ncbi:hypothetical protein F4Z99_12305 [Candidatus Poribacteria bacterium]|nr:hypothetical protein [Candidatus Poribacteria bacterium]